MKDAMERASFMPGGETGPNIRSAMYEQRAWAPLGLEGVCNPGTWTPTGHGGIDTIWVYMAHVGDQGRSMERVYTASLPRRSEEHTSELQSLLRISYAVF